MDIHRNAHMDLINETNKRIPATASPLPGPAPRRAGPESDLRRAFYSRHNPVQRQYVRAGARSGTLPVAGTRHADRRGVPYVAPFLCLHISFRFFGYDNIITP